MKILEQQDRLTTQEDVYNFVMQKFHEMGWLNSDVCREIMLQDYQIMRERYEKNGVTVARTVCDHIAMGKIENKELQKENSALFDMFVGLSKIILSAKSYED